ncbi:hypothetical protein ES705_07556 [subsurface metagenome]
MIITKGFGGGGRFFSIAIKGYGRWFDIFYKTVSEAIGVAERRLVASRTYQDGQYIQTFILSDMWTKYEDAEKVETVWSERRNLKSNN